MNIIPSRYYLLQWEAGRTVRHGMILRRPYVRKRGHVSVLEAKHIADKETQISIDKNSLILLPIPSRTAQEYVRDLGYSLKSI